MPAHSIKSISPSSNIRYKGPVKEYGEWYAKNRARLSTQGLWLRGGEPNTLPPEAFASRDFRVLFTRLSTYFDTGYSFTHQLLYQLAADLEGVYPDLAYLPPGKDVPLFREAGVPWLLGTQSKRGAADFDLIGFSNSIVQELINLPHFLVTSGLPLKKSERLERPDLPLIVLGGANALYTSAIWESDPMVDGIFVGESDKAITQILITARDGKRAGKHKREILAELEKIPGFFQPEAPRVTNKAFIWSLNQSTSLERGPVYFLEDQLGKGHLQISEGCPCFCSFCAESWDRKPYRERNRQVLLDSALKMKAAMGLDTIELYSFNFNMHSQFYGVLWDLAPYFKRIGLKSQRFDLLAHDPEMIEFQHVIEKASITCGLEGISPRLRKYLHKNLENHELHRSLTAIFKSRARELKVFLIATGLEEEEDFIALGDLLDHLRKIKQEVGAHTRIIFSMTPLVRFPWTPLEFEPAASVASYEKIIRKAAKTIRSAGLEFRESADLPEYWVSQVLVRADDERVAHALRDAIFRNDFVYYREIPHFFQKKLEEALERRGVDLKKALAGYTLEESFQKPWAKISTGVKREFLWEEVLRARAYKEIDYCLGRAWQESKCFLCGGCPSPQHILDIVKTKQVRDYSLADLKDRMKQIREGERTIRLRVRVGPKGRGVPRKLVAVALARGLMLQSRALNEGYRGFTGSFWGDESLQCPVEGQDRFELLFDSRSARELEERLGDAGFLQAVNRELGEWGELLGDAAADWAPDHLVFTGAFQFQADGYFRGNGLKFTLRRDPQGRMRYDLAADSLKKRIIAAVEAESEPYRLVVKPGPKFQLSAFIEKGIAPLPGQSHPDFRCYCH